MKFIPRKYQVEGKEFLQARNFAMLGDAPGVGKTGQAILAVDPLWARTLIVCPASVKGQWQQALLNWCGYGSQILNTTKDKVNVNAQFVITNYDLMIRDGQLKQLMGLTWDLIIFDEAHKLKSITAKRTKAALSMKGLKSQASRIWFLTGTPVKNRTIDLYPILRSCAPEVLGTYSSFMKFSYRYCGGHMGRFGFDNSGASHTEELAARMKNFMLRREKRDVLTELPPRIVTVVPMDCTPQVRQIIREVEWQTVEQAGENDPALFKLGEIQRMRGALAKYKVPLAVDYIKDLLEEENKIVVFFYHKEVLHDLQTAFKDLGTEYIDGSISPSKRAGIVKAFTGDANTRLFLGQMEACGEGIDGLQNASSTCVFVEPSWSHTDIEQCIGRLERSGQRSDVNVHILTIKETLEARMMEVVAEKLKVDVKLYGTNKTTKEKKMAKEQVDPRIEAALALADAVIALCKVYTAEKTAEVHPETEEETPVPTPAPEKKGVKKTAPQEVKPAEEEDVSEEAIRTRAGDICALKPDGTGKTKCAEVIKKIGGGKIADLNTPELRIKCLAALDKTYNEMAK